MTTRHYVLAISVLPSEDIAYVLHIHIHHSAVHHGRAGQQGVLLTPSNQGARGHREGHHRRGDCREEEGRDAMVYYVMEQSLTLNI